MNFKLKWTTLGAATVTIKIYRGTTDIDRANLTGLVATLTAGESEWTDTTAVRGTTYSYVFESITATDRSVSRNYRVVAGNRRGPGPQLLQLGDMEYGYFGELTVSEFISAADLRVAVGMSVGTVLANPTAWHKFARKGKILIIPSKALTNNILWTQLYNLGLVFGTDDMGKGNFLLVPNVNQKRTVKIGPDTFIVRLMTGYSDNVADVPPTTEAATDPTDAFSNEWEDLVYPLNQYVPAKQRMANVANYTAVQQGLNANYQCHVQERASATQHVTRGSNAAGRAAVGTRAIATSTTGGTNSSWWPVFELVDTVL